MKLDKDSCFKVIRKKFGSCMYHHIMWMQYQNRSFLGHPKVRFSVSANEGDLLQLI